MDTLVQMPAPSQVCLWRSLLPLIATFGHAETEFAAALLVQACAHFGDSWNPQTPQQLGVALKVQLEDPKSGWAQLDGNPFVPRPDFRKLAEEGFARFLGDPDAKGTPIEFTENGFAVLRKVCPARKPTTPDETGKVTP